MNKLLFGVFVALLLVVGVLVSVLLLNDSSISNVSALEDCNSLSVDGVVVDGVNILFFGSLEDSSKYADYLLSIAPYDSLKDKINFFFISSDSYVPNCELYKGIALFCYNKELLVKSGSCPNDVVVVLNSDYDSSIRSSSYTNVVSINTKLPLSVLPHELAHALVNLADEYVPSTIPKGSDNCVTSCDSFIDDYSKDGCFVGCGEEDNYRSVNNGLMRTLSSDDYGVYDESLISSEIASIISKRTTKASSVTGSAVGGYEECSSQEYFLVYGTHNGGSLTIVGKELVTGCIGDSGKGSYDYSIVLLDGSVVKDDSFNPELLFIDFSDGGEAFGYDGLFYLKVPLISDSDTLEISKDGVFMSSIKLSSEGNIPCKL
ncbi:hypothetical protein COU61_00990 [Candidatus Pacearchaeota archaeon CG10_big_fil_rev_8_21_14_0_10_35_13]|nr:MAG: hypothetical protein COU61_00990 [Candidatus Pacearchaeota archaeon CG10_big_fil_rev_8_21_14_0_10_35_13]